MRSGISPHFLNKTRLLFGREGSGGGDRGVDREQCLPHPPVLTGPAPVTSPGAVASFFLCYHLQPPTLAFIYNSEFFSPFLENYCSCKMDLTYAREITENSSQ